jgi:hypothetical protein
MTPSCLKLGCVRGFYDPVVYPHLCLSLPLYDRPVLHRRMTTIVGIPSTLALFDDCLLFLETALIIPTMSWVHPPP